MASTYRQLIILNIPAENAEYNYDAIITTAKLEDNT